MVQTRLAPWLHGTLTGGEGGGLGVGVCWESWEGGRRGKGEGATAVLSAGGAQNRGGLGVAVAGCNVVGRAWGKKGVAVGIRGAVEA